MGNSAFMGGGGPGGGAAHIPWKDIKADFGAAGDGVTDDSAAFLSFKTYGQSQTGLVRLIIPPGNYKVTTTGANASLWMQGIPRLEVQGHGASFVGQSQIIGTTPTWPSTSAGVCPINSALAGATTVTLVNLSDASKVIVNAWIALAAYDMQGAGSYPPNLYLFEYKQVKAVDLGTGIVTFYSPLTNNYLSTYPLRGAAIGGPASLYIMDPAWDTEISISGVNFATTGINDIFGGGRRIVLDNCKFSTKSWASTTASYIKIRNSDLGPHVELDKLIERIELDGCWMNNNSGTSGQYLIQSSCVRSIHMNNCKIGTLNGIPQHFVARNSLFDSLFLYGIAFGINKTALLENCYVGSLTVSPPAVSVPTGNVVNGVITIPKNPVVSGLYPGSIMVADNAASGLVAPFPLSFAVLDVQTDGTNLIAYTTLPASFSAPVISGNYHFYSHPCPNLTVDGCYGCIDIVNASHAPNEKPVFSYIRQLVVAPGSLTTNVGDPAKIWGRIVSVTVNVLRAYTGTLGTLTIHLGQFGVPCVATDGITTFNWNPTINIKTAGKRVYTATGSTGLQTGDTDPGSGAFWFHGTTRMFASADTTAESLEKQAVIDLEIITDQELVTIENLLFTNQKYYGL